MSEEQHQPPPDAVLRFRMRTMIAVTTALAATAAAVGLLFRRLTPVAQSALLVEWGVTSTFILFFAARRWQLYVRGVRAAGPVRFVLRHRRQWAQGLSRLPIFWTLLAVGLLAGHWQSIERAVAGESRGSMEAFFTNLLTAPLLCTASVFIMSGVASGRAVRLCEHGLRAAGEFKDWRQVSLAQWSDHDDCAVLISTWTERRGYELLVPSSIRGEVEAFLQLKTHFVKDAASPPV
jgi:hypothetical protein